MVRRSLRFTPLFIGVAVFLSSCAAPGSKPAPMSDAPRTTVLHSVETRTSCIQYVVITPDAASMESLRRLGADLSAQRSELASFVVYVWDDAKSAYAHFAANQARLQEGSYCATFDPDSVTPEHFVATYMRREEIN